MLSADSADVFGQAREHMSSADAADLELCRMSDTLNGADVRLSLHDGNGEFWQGFRKQALPVWFDVLAAFCEFHPAAPYIDPLNTVQHCSGEAPLIHTDRAKFKDLFASSLTLQINFYSFSYTQNCKGDEACLQRQVDSYKPLLDAIQHSTTPNPDKPTAPNISPSSSDHHNVEESGTPQCAENISFAIAQGGQISVGVPTFVEKWVAKNANKFRGICFSQNPVLNVENYLLVFATHSQHSVGFTQVYELIPARA